VDQRQISTWFAIRLCNRQENADPVRENGMSTKRLHVLAAVTTGPAIWVGIVQFHSTTHELLTSRRN